MRGIKNIFVDSKGIIKTYTPTILMFIGTFIIAVLGYYFEVGNSRSEMLIFAIGVSLFEAVIMFVIIKIENKYHKNSEENDKL